MKIFLLTSLFVLIYTWVGYFLLLNRLVRLRTAKCKQAEDYPSVTLLLTVYNEESLIEARLNNLLLQEYPSDLLDILVASDGSTDRTNAIIEGYAKKNNRIRLYKGCGEGKSATQNSAIPFAKGEIIVLTDADTVFEKDTIKQIVKPFADKDVGCASGRLVLGQGVGAVAESQGMYWKFEMALRKMESQIGALHTATGGIMAFRKNLFRPFDPKYGDDCIIPLDIIIQGYVVVHADSAVAYDSFPSSLEGELKARTRMTLRNITCTLSKYHLLNPFKYRFVSLAIFSHKLLRWATPFFMIVVLGMNILLINENLIFLFTTIAQLLFYILGVIGLICELCKMRIPVCSQIFSFLLANIGFLLGVLSAIFGEHVTSYKNPTVCQDSSFSSKQ